MIRWLNPLLAVYAVVLILSGIQAYFFASVPNPNPMSLFGGVVSGLLILGTLALAQTNPRPARIAAAMIALLLTGMFLGRYVAVEPRAVWPNLLLGLFSLIVFLALGAGHLLARSKVAKGLPDPQEGTVSKLDPITGLRRDETVEEL